MATKDIGTGERKDIQESFPNVGQDEATLKQYGLSQKKVIQSAIRTQALANAYLATDNIVGKIVDSITKNPSEKIADYMPIFNIPFCDLDKVTDFEFSGGNCEKMSTPTDPTIARVCLHRMLSINCKKLVLGNSDWPYTYT